MKRLFLIPFSMAKRQLKLPVTKPAVNTSVSPTKKRKMNGADASNEESKNSRRSAKSQKTDSDNAQKVVKWEDIKSYSWCRTYPGSTVSLMNPPLKDSNSWTFKLVTWNVNGLRACIKNGGLNYIIEEQPDAVGLQEIKCQSKDIPPTANLSEFKSYWFPADKPGYAGTGLYSKTVPINIRYGIGSKEHDNEGRTITAEYENFFFITTYVPNSGRGLVRLKYRTERWDKAFCEYVKQLDKKKPVIVSGDLNVAHEEIDLKNPDGNHKTAGFTDEERKSFTHFLADADLVDTYRHFYPDRRDAYTFWSTMKRARESNSGWRLDYFLVSRRFLSHVVDQEFRCGILGSDHCPVVTYIKL